MEAMICGLDEAGRGPVIGPLVVAGVQAEDEKTLCDLGIKDSKKCTPLKREKLSAIVRDKSVNVHALIINAEDIDRLRRSKTINEIEVEAFAQVMKILKSDVYYVDSADVNERRFAEELRKHLDFDARIISEHKAEEKFIIVAAASILAKTTRDEQIKLIERELRKKLDMPLGSGYPSDPVTINFLREWIKRFGDLPPHTRKTWKTVKKLLSKQSTLW